MMKNKHVLIVVDVQVGVMQTAWEADRIIKNIVVAVNKARAQHIPIVWVQHSDDELIYGSPEWEWVPELSPAADEKRIDKNYNSSFEQTPLEEILASLGVAHIVLAGAATNWCIRATAYGALERGYDLTLLKDAHTTDTIDLGNGVTIEAADVIRDLNVTMSWVSYPERSSYATSVEEFDFINLGNNYLGN
jgi:nicotinamidase-related amidase